MTILFIFSELIGLSIEGRIRLTNGQTSRRCGKTDASRRLRNGKATRKGKAMTAQFLGSLSSRPALSRERRPTD